MQKYCPECSASKDRERKRDWALRSGYTPNSESARKRTEMLKNLAAKAPPENGIDWDSSSVGENPEWEIRVEVPFTYSYSKNAVWSMRGGAKGHVFMRKSSNQARKDLARAITAELRKAGHNVVEAKLFVDIYVRKPDHRGDAINVVDVVCDAVEDATGLDDRWYSIRGLDWEVSKSEPAIFVGVSQRKTEHHRVCSYCGRIKPLTEFGKRRHGRLGHGRTCKPCGRVASARNNVGAE